MNVELARSQVMQCKENIQTDEQAIAYINKITNQHMDWNRPLWEMRFLENYEDDKSIVFVRMHH